jgi:peptidoglycan/LPS O-acetylase OafA/YrhL
MIRRLPILNGIAALMVVLKHTTSYGFNAMFLWADRYRVIDVPTFDMIGTLPYYILFIINRMADIAIPAFLFISGYIIAFTSKTNTAETTRNYSISRIKKLIAPFLVWSLVVNILLLRRFPPPIEDIIRMYYYIPLVIQYYLLSSIIVHLAQKRWMILLTGAAVLQIGVEIIGLLRLLNIDYFGHNQLTFITALWLFPGKILFFVFGVVAGLHQEQFSRWTKKHCWKLITLMLLLGSLSYVEYSLVSNLTEIPWLVPHYSGVMHALFTISFVLCFFAFENLKIPYTKELSELGGKSLGIYLLNTPAIFLAASAMYYFTPWALEYQTVYQSVLFIVGLGLPLLFMKTFKRSWLRKAYPYFCG